MLVLFQINNRSTGTKHKSIDNSIIYRHYLHYQAAAARASTTHNSFVKELLLTMVVDICTSYSRRLFNSQY